MKPRSYPFSYGLLSFTAVIVFLIYPDSYAASYFAQMTQNSPTANYPFSTAYDNGRAAVAASSSPTYAKANANAAIDLMVAELANKASYTNNQQVNKTFTAGAATVQMEMTKFYEYVDSGPRPWGWKTYYEGSYTLTWPDNQLPTATISPTTLQTIYYGNTVTFSSVASDTDSNLTKHSFDWKNPDGTWVWSAPGYVPTSLSNPGGETNIVREKTFAETNSSSMTVTFKPNKPGNYKVRFSAADGSSATNTSQEVTLAVLLPSPTQTLQVLSQVYVGEQITLLQTASNPTIFPEYQIGFRIEERREDPSGNVYQDWLQLNYESPSLGNRSYTTTRSAPVRVGVIRYHIQAWNQWMQDSENLLEYTVQVPNRPPNYAQVILSTPTIYFGESVAVTGYLSDLDGNLKGHSLWVNEPASVLLGQWNPIGRTLIPDWWGGAQNESRWSGAWNNGIASSGTNSVVSGQFTPDRIGTWQVHTNGCDDQNIWGPGDTKYLGVLSTPPSGRFNGGGMSEGTPLTSAHLNATFTNPYNESFVVPGLDNITYTIVGGGNATFPDNSTVIIGSILPKGVYTLRATIPASANYLAGAKDVTFTVREDRDADNDSDGLNNGIEDDLGLDPNTPASRDPAAVGGNVLTPIE